MSIVANCQQCYQSLMSLQLNAIQSNCTTDVFLSLADVVYTLGDKKVSILATAAQDISSVIVDAETFAQIVHNTSTSLEASASNAEFASAILDIYANFPQGLLNYGLHNIAHSRICASLAVSLNFL